MSKASQRKHRSLAQTMGGIIVGFDQQIFRTTPPAHELVQKGAPVRGLSGEDGRELVVTLPHDVDSRSKDPEPESL